MALKTIDNIMKDISNGKDSSRTFECILLGQLVPSDKRVFEARNIKCENNFISGQMCNESCDNQWYEFVYTGPYYVEEIRED